MFAPISIIVFCFWKLFLTKSKNFTSKKLLLLFDRIKQHLKLFVPTQFNKQHVIKLYWKIINDVATLDSLLLYNSKFAIVYKERVNNFEEEMKKENILNQCCIPLKNIKCLINKIQRIS